MAIVSATKYYSGHSDVMGGSLAVNKKVFSKVYNAERITGLRLGPDDAYLITRGLRTLDVRLDRHSENAKKVAAFLSKNKKFKLLYQLNLALTCLSYLQLNTTLDIQMLWVVV